MCSDVTENRIRGGLAPLSSLAMLKNMYGSVACSLLIQFNPSAMTVLCRKVAHNQLEGLLDPIASLRELSDGGRWVIGAGCIKMSDGCQCLLRYGGFVPQ